MKRRYVVAVVVLIVAAIGLSVWLTLPSLASEVEERGGKVVVEPDTPEGRTVSVVFTARKNIEDADLACLRNRKGFQRLFLDSTSVRGPGLEYLKDSGDLRWLSMGSCPLTDKGLMSLPALPRLEFLNLSQTRVTDAGLARVAQQKTLRHLFLSHTAVTDAGLEHLRGLDQLEELVATATGITEAGVRHLQEAVPTLVKVQIGKGEE